ncbi:MAG: hypothetical protein ACO396_07875 [Phycisphaerales bacterium]|jgi:hypothetical protein
MTNPSSAPLALESIASAARERDVFEAVEFAGERVSCKARDAATDAFYRLESRNGRLFASLVTPDRWLSESIESDLMHYGDPLEELVAEELAEFGLEVPESELVVKHFRSDDLLYTFETPLPAPIAADADKTLRFLLAYEAAFRALGDMSGSDED